MAALIYMMRGSIPKMLDAIKQLRLAVWIGGLLLYIASIAIVSFRLKILLATQNIFLSISNIMQLNFVGYFFSSFLPTSVGGDVVKAFYISKASNKTVLSYTSVFIDRFLGISAMILIATGAIFYTKEIPKAYFRWLLPLLLIASGLFLTFLFNRRFAKTLSSFVTPIVPLKIREKVKNIYDAMHNFKDYKFRIFGCVLISMAAQVTAFSAISIFASGLGSSLPLKFVLLAMAVACVVSMLPSIYGMGPREMSIVIILSPLIGNDKALAIAFMWLGLLLTISLIGGIIYVLMGPYKIKPSDVAA
jgi:uncharacterized protein (TIRG00374 family)